MSHLPSDPSRDAVPIRLFKSDFLEFFTHISPVTIVVIWLPIAAYLVLRAVLVSGAAAYIPAAFVLGVFIWTLAE
jgi:hypothetical protein